MQRFLDFGSRAVRSRAPRLGLIAAFAMVLTGMSTAAPALAQEPGAIRGAVTDPGTAQPVSGAQVSLRGTTRGTLTDARGIFLITNVAPGQYTVRIESIGFRTVEQQVTVRAGETAVTEMQMAASAIGLDEIVVTGTAGRTTRRARSQRAAAAAGSHGGSDRAAQLRRGRGQFPDARARSGIALRW
jgi:iron complex outermembrane recepter protein